MGDQESWSGSASPSFPDRMPAPPYPVLVDDSDEIPWSSPTEFPPDAHKRRRTSVVQNHVKKQKVDGKDKKLSLGESRQGKASLNPYHFDEDVARKELANMVILHEYPLTIVEHVGFRKFSAALQPLFKMVSRNTLKRDILKIYDHERGKTLMKVENNPSRVAITTDMWTSSDQKRGFMAVTAHYIDDSWSLESQVMRFIYVPSPHTEEVLSDVLLDCMFDWNVDRKLSTVTVDNCSKSDAIIKMLLDRLQGQVSSFILRGSLLHMRCAAYIINLIVQDGLALIGEGMEKVRDSVVFWTASQEREQKFEETARQVRVSSTKKLVLDCKTRWNSTYLMLSTALVYKDVFFRLRKRDPSYDCIPSENDWELIEDICGRLELFYNATEVFSGTTYATTNMFFPKVCQLKIALHEWITCPNELIRIMASNMLEKFDSYWNVVHGIMCVAVVLDPRYKMMLLEWFFPKIYGARANEEIEKIRKICYDLLEEYHSVNTGKEASGTNSSSRVTKSSKSRIEDSLFNFDFFVSSKRSSGNVKLEFDRYIEDGVLPRTPDFDVLAWWRTNGLKYPTLQCIARDILAIPVSTIVSEPAFSTSGRLLSPPRSRLHPKTLEALMCARNWLWSEIKGSSSMPEGSTIQTILDDYDDHEEESAVTELQE